MLKSFSSGCLALQPAVRLQMCKDAKAIFPFGQVSELDFFSLPKKLTTCFTLKQMSQVQQYYLKVSWFDTNHDRKASVQFQYSPVQN